MDLNGGMPSTEQEIIEALQELEKWKGMVEKAESEKSRWTLEKLDSESVKKKFQKETTDLIKLQEKRAEEYIKAKEQLEANILDCEKRNKTLKDQIKEYDDSMKRKKAEYMSLQEKSKIKADIPENKVKFTGVKKLEESDQEEEYYETIQSQFTITCRPSIPLTRGSALITFEEEAVAERILILPKCSVEVDRYKMAVKPLRVTLEPTVKFEVHFRISKKKIRFSNVPVFVDESRTRDRLELSFSKPSLGGGEVEDLDFNPETSAGQVTFLNTGVAERLCLKRKYPIDLGQKSEVCIQPHFVYMLQQFQTFCGVSKRTILLKDIMDVVDEEDMQDHLEIYFQKPSNYGGEVETIKYISKREAVAYFSDDVPKN